MFVFFTARTTRERKSCYIFSITTSTFLNLLFESQLLLEYSHRLAGKVFTVSPDIAFPVSGIFSEGVLKTGVELIVE
jgi:hypothetical protein